MAGPSIANQTPAEVFSNLLLAGDNGQGLSTTPLQLQDGIGNQAPMYIATNAINFDRAQGQFQLDGVALTATAATLNNLTDFSTAQYIVMAPNVQLPQAFQLLASNGLQLNSGAGTVTIQPTPGSELNGLQALNSTGIVIRSAGGTYTTRSLQTDATIQLTNASGVTGNPTLSVINDTNVQRVNLQENGVFQFASSQLNFIPGLNTGINVQQDIGNNRANITITSSPLTSLFIKASCQAATTANLNATYNNGAAGVGATLTNNGALAALSIDGYNANLDDRILIKNQNTEAQNGIYIVTVVGSGAVAWVLTRADDFNSPSNIQSGDYTNIINGTVNKNTAWIETNNVNIIGTDPIAWTQFGFGGSVTSVSGTAAQIDVVNGTTTPVISIDPAYVGQNSITTLGTITTGIWNGTIIDLAHGGSNANLVASNGGIIYSNATQMQVLAGTATADQILLSGSNAAPSWSTTTWPNLVSASNLLYANGANKIAGLATQNSAMLVTNNAGVPSMSATMTNGQLIIGSTGATPTAATLTAGANVTITNAAGSITIAASATPGGNWINQNTNTVTLVAGDSYMINNGGVQVVLTLPAAPNFGDTFKIVGSSAGGWKVAQNALQTITTQAGTSTAGVTGFIASTNQYDCITITYLSANNFIAYQPQGNITVS